MRAVLMGKDKFLPYRVGSLLYMPANKIGVADKIANNAYPCLSSVALDLEDSIQNRFVCKAEEILLATLEDISRIEASRASMPLVFVRVRNPEHLRTFAEKLLWAGLSITGFILPKFDVSNASEYMKALRDLQGLFKEAIYGMPVLESRLVASLGTRVAMLEEIRDVLDKNRELILNIRVGGNDLSNLYGIRRSSSQTIYEVGVVRDILSNIINVFGADYVVSAPVWEYFGNDNQKLWRAGLAKEVEQDLLNGFFGKTAIHPCQLPVIAESMMVDELDYQDAKMIVSWPDEALAVRKSFDGTRMNELKCHLNWAQKTLFRAEVYGVRGGSFR